MYFIVLILLFNCVYATWDNIIWTPIVINQEQTVELVMSDISNDYCNFTETLGRYLNISTSFENIQLTVSRPNYVFIHIFEQKDETHVCYDQIYSHIGMAKTIVNSNNGCVYIRIGTDILNKTSAVMDYSIKINVKQYSYANQIIFICALYLIASILLLIVIVGLVGFYFYTDWKFKKSHHADLIEEKTTNYQRSSLSDNEKTDQNSTI